MRKVFLFWLVMVLLVAVSAMAQNKVVVIPMGSSAKGTDGQIQYNDGGKTAGAEVYYDKATGKLELPGELRTVDGAGNSRLWGKAMPGSLLTHTDPNGYCTTSAGVKYALSARLESWGNTDKVCPQGTWVCTHDDLPTEGSCNIQQLLSTFLSVSCDGATSPSSRADFNYMTGWEYAISDEIDGVARNSGDFSLSFVGTTCIALRAWCCWE